MDFCKKSTYLHVKVSIETATTLNSNVPVFTQKEEKKTSGAKEAAETKANTGKAAEHSAAVGVERAERVERVEASLAEYTELALDCLDLKAQEELLSPPPSGASHCFPPPTLCSRSHR